MYIKVSYLIQVPTRTIEYIVILWFPIFIREHIAYLTIFFSIKQMIMEHIKNKMCCIPIVLCAWLCSYISMIPDKAREKPLQMIQMLQTPAMNPDPDLNYNER